MFVAPLFYVPSEVLGARELRGVNTFALIRSVVRAA